MPSGTYIGGRFQIKQFLGASGLGERYRAIDAKTERPIDVRILHPGMLEGEPALERLRQEIQLAATLQHKNIAATYGMGNEGDLYYIATEYIDGETLRELIDAKSAQQKLFSLKGAYNVVAHLCNGLAHAHQTLFHGALSPSNILVNRAGRVKMTDFGIARTLPALTQFRAQLAAGEFYCMAPELAEAPETADRRVDIYSVGVVLFELLTGRAPSDTFESPQSVRPELPQALDTVVERCLRPSPDERFYAAEELKQALFLAVEQAHIPQAPPARGVQIVARPSTPAPAPRSATPAVPAAAPRSATPSPAAARGRPQPAPTLSASAPLPIGDPLPWAAAVAPPAAAAGPLHGSGPVAQGPVYTGPPVDESLEIWLVQKNKLDFGPFSMAEVKRQIEKGEIEGNHLIIDSDSGKRCRVADHPYLAHFCSHAEMRIGERRRAEADAQLARREKRRAVTVIIVCLILAGAATAAVLFWMHIHRQAPVVLVKEVPKADTDLEKILKGLKFEFPPPVIKKRKLGKGGKRGGFSGADDFDEPTKLGDVTQEGGEEQLTPQQIQSTMTARGRSLAVCIAEERRRNPTLQQIELEFIVHGTGQVTAVRVNGQKGTPLASCMFGRMRQIPFPKYNGPKTIAGFSWNVQGP